MDMGYLEFWLNQASDSNSTNIQVIGENNHDSRLVANIMKNMDQLPPQWNYVPFYKEYGFFCEKDLSSFEWFQDKSDRVFENYYMWNS